MTMKYTALLNHKRKESIADRDIEKMSSDSMLELRVRHLYSLEKKK